MSDVLALLATALFALAYVPYFTRLARREIRPRALYWVLWSCCSGVGAATYWELTGHDLAKSALALGGAAFAALASLMRLSQVLADWRLRRMAADGSLGMHAADRLPTAPQKFDAYDAAVTVGTLLALAAWRNWSPAAGNAVQLAAAVIAHVPLIRQLAHDPSAEKPLPWIGWACADTLMLCVLATKGTAAWVEFLAPVTYFTLTVAVIWLCSRTKPVGTRAVGLSRTIDN